ncbi:aspartate aminotransferase family protein [Kytococcus sp. Marseille-QA3725]
MTEPWQEPRTDARWYAADEELLAGVEKLRFFPQVAEHGKGSVLTTPEGREVLDLSASWTATGLGLGHPDVVEAVSRAAAHPPGGSLLSGAHPGAVGLARDLLDLVPTRGDDRQVYLGHAGSDANDVAVAATRHATGRRRIVAFKGGYHGGIGRSRGVSGVHVEAGVEAEEGLTLVPYPDPYRPWCPGDLLERSLAVVADALAAGDVAALMVEPVQCDGGVVLPPDGFLTGLRDLADEYGALLVVDEVKAGLGRTGHLLAHQHEDVVPDLVTLGKALGNGLPLSAAVGPTSTLGEPVASALMTTVGNPVCCAAGRAVLGLLRDGAITERAVHAGERVRDLLREHAGSGRPGAGAVGDVRGRGLLIGLELVVPGTTEPDPELAAATSYAGWQHGVVAYPVRGNVLEITPALTMTADELERAVGRLLDALDSAARGEVDPAVLRAYSGW